MSPAPLPSLSAADADDPWLLAGGARGHDTLQPLVNTVLTALRQGALERCGPLPAGGPEVVADRVDAAIGIDRQGGGDALPRAGAGFGTVTGAGAPAGSVGRAGAEYRARDGAAGLLPEVGAGSPAALHDVVRALAAGSADPADPLCAAHLHCPPLAVAAAADLAASTLNPSMDSWDQAPAASALEARTCRTLAELVYGPGTPADSVITTGGTESNQLGLLLARELLGSRVRVVCGANAHHSVQRAAWLLGLDPPLVVPAPGGVLDPGGLADVLAKVVGPALVVATAGTTDTGGIDPLPEIASVATTHGARLHVDAAYGGPLLFSEQLSDRLAGLARADSVTLDLHKLGWQPVAAGVFAVSHRDALGTLEHRAEYLNADDDTLAGIPDLLGRSLRTTRRPDVLKIAVTLRALGRRGLATLVERTCLAARRLAELVKADPAFELAAPPALSTVVFRPLRCDEGTVADIRRRLLAEGRAVLGRAVLDGQLWLKVTLLNPHVRTSDLTALLKLVRDAAGRTEGSAASDGRRPGDGHQHGPPPPHARNGSAVRS
ncbi:pyridoxal phosphate-dependent decarboxylase family protein [Streptomyces oceani]|uniref:pyridoxal phosphate-dependent decarboxylase family protein n=1 Tax=Streptomyces oceani TaxID=1075402 RepID=UPI000871BBB9|nr:aminotransferase class V-fold PLP-dependent enzyme [Streptomyces oceani]